MMLLTTCLTIFETMTASSVRSYLKCRPTRMYCVHGSVCHFKFSQVSASSYFSWSGYFMQSFVTCFCSLQNKPNHFYWKRYMFDRHRANNKSWHVFETRCIYNGCCNVIIYTLSMFIALQRHVGIEIIVISWGFISTAYVSGFFCSSKRSCKQEWQNLSYFSHLHCAFNTYNMVATTQNIDSNLQVSNGVIVTLSLITSLP